MTDEERYTNRQIERMLDDQSNDLKGHFDLVIKPLVVQVTKTNGRVSWLEKMMWLALGALAIAMPLLTWVVNTVSKQQAVQTSQIQQAVRDALEIYEINP